MIARLLTIFRPLRNSRVVDHNSWLIQARQGLPEQPDIDPVIEAKAASLRRRMGPEAVAEAKAVQAAYEAAAAAKREEERAALEALEAAKAKDAKRAEAKARRAEIAAKVRRRHLRAIGGGQ